MENGRIAGVLSIIYPGVGQLYNGRIKKWFYYTCLQILLTVLFPPIFRIADLFTTYLFLFGIITIILLPLALIPFCWLAFGFIFLPRHSAYKDAIEKVETYDSNRETNKTKYFSLKQRLTIVVLVLMIEVLISLFLFEYSWEFTTDLLL
ncbi:hypothetical protein LOZ80_38850 [Paenibacillus sp. HWE-109]|uniref:hypothetical protein n=1 Tax=Paenibacillus sp. HWE-109 TaxID=1306526 RepID=UPI001EDF5ECA|nr:hypothetical protein [Paenibacillus sp. HWE-109]UKS27328.1 hypothetical protein LOZ80_38850 [Paenibacillus sp. HWE-109]